MVTAIFSFGNCQRREYNGKITKYDSIEKLEKKMGLSSNGEYIDLWQN